MDKAITTALRLLSHFWLEEISSEDLETIRALPPLARTLPELDSESLTGLAVEYQRLFGFNLPPYESIFIDPSAMLMAPATERIQSLYRRQGWPMPSKVRTGAPDHIGVELLALADWLDQGHAGPALELHGRHLALWGPPFILTLQRQDPHPFYQTLAELTLDLLLTTLSDNAVPTGVNLFPTLPPPPVYRGTEDRPPRNMPESGADSSAGDIIELLQPPDDAGFKEASLRDIAQRLLTPREAGLFLSRLDLAKIGTSLDLPGVMGDRSKMLQSLFRQAGQYELIPELLDHLDRLTTHEDTAYRGLSDDYPPWTPYARAWRDRLSATRAILKKLSVALTSSTPLET